MSGYCSDSDDPTTTTPNWPSLGRLICVTAASYPAPVPFDEPGPAPVSAPFRDTAPLPLLDLSPCAAEAFPLPAPLLALTELPFPPGVAFSDLPTTNASPVPERGDALATGTVALPCFSPRSDSEITLAGVGSSRLCAGVSGISCSVSVRRTTMGDVVLGGSE